MVKYSAVDVEQMLSNLDLMGSNRTEIPPGQISLSAGIMLTYACLMSSFMKRDVFILLSACFSIIYKIYFRKVVPCITCLKSYLISSENITVSQTY